MFEIPNHVQQFQTVVSASVVFGVKIDLQSLSSTGSAIDDIDGLPSNYVHGESAMSKLGGPLSVVKVWNLLSFHYHYLK